MTAENESKCNYGVMDLFNALIVAESCVSSARTPEPDAQIEKNWGSFEFKLKDSAESNSPFIQFVSLHHVFIG